jgi:hypothetical protein
MRSSERIVISRLHLPRPLDGQQVTQFLARLASDRAAPRVVFEARADRHGIRHLLATRDQDVHGIRRTLTDLIPGSLLLSPTPLASAAMAASSEARPDVDVAGRLRVQPPGLSLRTDDAEATARALLSTLATKLKGDEQLVLQIVVGPRRAPRLVPTQTPDPGTGLMQTLLGGQRPANGDVRSRIRTRAEQAGFALTIRLGVRSPDHD